VDHRHQPTHRGLGGCRLLRGICYWVEWECRSTADHNGNANSAKRQFRFKRLAGDKPTAASGGKTYLTQLSPLQAGAFGVTDGPVQIGSDTYRNSISFACGEGAAETQSVVYDVAGFHYLNATVGIPNDSPDTTGTAANVIFHKTGTSTPIGPPISSTPGNAQAVHINLHGAAQLTISCAGAGTTIALGDAALSSP
jgi:hypothetical protein